jgi:hypothetical protein
MFHEKSYSTHIVKAVALSATELPQVSYPFHLQNIKILKKIYTER